LKCEKEEEWFGLKFIVENSHLGIALCQLFLFIRIFHDFFSLWKSKWFNWVIILIPLFDLVVYVNVSVSLYLFTVYILIAVFIRFSFKFHFLNQLIILFNGYCSFGIDDSINPFCLWFLHLPFSLKKFLVQKHLHKYCIFSFKIIFWLIWYY